MSIGLGIRAHDLPAHDLNEMLKKIKSYGFTNIQFAPTKLNFLHNITFLNYGQSRFLNKKLCSAGIQVSILGCYVNIVSKDKNIRNEALNRFKNYLDMSRYFDNAIVATETGSVGNNGYTEQNFTDEAFLEVVKSLRELANQAEKIGALFAIEPGINHPIYNLQRTKELIELVNSPNLKLIFDPCNLISIDNFEEQDKIINDFFDSFNKRICAFHLKDFICDKGQLQIVPFGHGSLNKRLFLTRINEEFPHAFGLLESINESDIDNAVRIINTIC